MHFFFERRRARPSFAALALAAAAALAGCSTMNITEDRLVGLITPYRVEIVQGNVVTREMVALVKPGQTRGQVRDVLGSPLLADAFHADRWDYVFTIRRQGTPYQQRRVTVLFKNDVLDSVEADELPSEQEFVASIDNYRSSRSLPKLALSSEEVRALPAPAKPTPTAQEAALAAAPQGAARNYPPLEAAP